SEFRALDLASLTRDAIDFMEPMADERGITLLADVPEQASISGHRDLLFQAVINLIDNAIKFSPAGGTVSVSLQPVRDGWRLEVADQGPGIPVSEQERVFERLYRLEGARNTPGLGLGLSLVQSVARLHAGRIELGDAAPGLRAALTLPAGT
ncbi:MAG: ATP-binding protein, partial [Methyloversatilis sp.]|nr:ATP-binding protein [Methyloversatilis sp.]